MNASRELNPYAPPATDCSAENVSLDDLRKRLVKVREDCGALAVAWAILAATCLGAAALFAASGMTEPSFALPVVAALLIGAVVPTWRIVPAGVILGLIATYTLILGPMVLHPGISLPLALFLCPLIFQGHRILWNAKVLQRAGVELAPTAPEKQPRR